MGRTFSPSRGHVARRLAILSVLAPLSVAACMGLVRPPGDAPGALLTAPPAGASEPGLLPTLATQLKRPASVTRHRGASPGAGVLARPGIAPVDAVPARAWSAYERASTVIAAADVSCHLSWALIAAIGKVESDHGRFGGRLMTVDGLVHPALYGPRLDGRHGVARIGDTDAGRLDGDTHFDRAVGPMQFIPSTWTVVGVDGDADGRRDPQDVDDAALATAVYLCSGPDDLSTTAGQRSSVFRYNHSTAYVDLVLSIMNGYLAAGPGASALAVGAGYLPTLLGPHGPGSEPTHEPQPTFDVVPSHSTAPTGSGSPTAQPSVTASATLTASPTAALPTAALPTVDGTSLATPSPSTGSSSPAATRQADGDPTAAVSTRPAGPTASPTAAPSKSTTAPGDPKPSPGVGLPSSPAASPTAAPTGCPIADPTADPTGEPTAGPTADPTGEPTAGPTAAPSECPTPITGSGADVDDRPGGAPSPADDPGSASLVVTPPATQPQPGSTTSSRRVR